MFIKLGDYLISWPDEISEERATRWQVYLILGELERIGDRAVVFSNCSENAQKQDFLFSDATYGWRYCGAPSMR